MKNLIFIFFLITIFLSCSAKKIQISENQKMQIQYLDSIPGYSFTRSTTKVNTTTLLFLKRFNDTIEIYLDNKKVDTFFKNDYHYDNNGEEYIIHGEAPNIEIRSIPFKNKTTNIITIILKPSNERIRFDVRKGYDNYLVSRFNEMWYFTGLKSTIK